MSSKHRGDYVTTEHNEQQRIESHINFRNVLCHHNSNQQEDALF